MTTDPVRLGDIATIEGDDGRLAAIVIGKAPFAAETRMLDGNAILASLRREVGDVDTLRYTIPTTVRVRRATQELSEAAIRDAVETFIDGAMGTGAGDAVVRSIDVPGPVRIPAGASTMHVSAPPGAPLLGRVRLEVSLSVDDRPVHVVPVVADVGLYAPVVLARRPVARGEVLAEGDLSVERRDLSEMPRGVLTEVADAIGRVARVPIAPWAPVRRDGLAAAAVVHRGDTVLLVAERAGLRITAAGEARQDAGLGDPVRVVNRTSQKNLVGRVLDGSTVAVEF